MTGKLIICPTPIGNLGDMPPRALDALRTADTVCAEDTRVTGKLLAALGVGGKRLERLDENVIGQRAARIVERVREGEVIAYCTDAGMPGVSDPGLRLVNAAREANVPVEVLPGPSAATTAYVASGCVAPAYYFGGFFPRKSAPRNALLESLRALDAAVVFYESPNRLIDALKSIEAAYPLRQIAVCRELTKLHEEVLRGAAHDVREILEARDSVKGEIVVVIDAPNNAERAADADVRAADAVTRAAELLAQGARPKQIARQLTEELGISRNEAYAIATAAAKGD